MTFLPITQFVTMSAGKRREFLQLFTLQICKRIVLPLTPADDISTDWVKTGCFPHKNAWCL